MKNRRFCALLLLAAPAIAIAQQHPSEEHAAHAGSMEGLLGGHPMSREASGTSWQPELAPMTGVHFGAGDWMWMAHGFADLVYDRQGGPRGDEKVFVPSMAMLMGSRPLGEGTWGLRAMGSLDPLMGRAGYPLLLQSGETADGETELVDRQHPHDAFMELATTYSHPVGEGRSAFLYLGLPGEPALGPPAFMHRASGLALPEAPLSHHWLDSTHVSFGVATLGVATSEWKLEASAFNGREPDERRWNIETRRIDSYAGRVTWNPSPAWSAQVSHGYLASPESLEPGVAVHRTTASLSHSAAGEGAQWHTTLAAGVNRAEQDDHPAYAIESTRRAGRLALFGRAEWLHNEHLVEAGPLAGREFQVGKLSLGASWRVARVDALAFDLGALASGYAIPSALEPEYGEPASGMLFLRTSLE